MPADCMFNIQNMTTPAFFFLYANRLINSFFKKEHFVSTLFVGCSVTDIQRFIRINMMFIVKFNNMKAAAVDVKVDIPFFKIRCFSLPDFHLRMQFFNGAPGGIADSTVVRVCATNRSDR